MGYEGKLGTRFVHAPCFNQNISNIFLYTDQNRVVFAKGYHWLIPLV